MNDKIIVDTLLKLLEVMTKIADEQEKQTEILRSVVVGPSDHRQSIRVRVDQ